VRAEVAVIPQPESTFDIPPSSGSLCLAPNAESRKPNTETSQQFPALQFISIRNPKSAIRNRNPQQPVFIDKAKHDA